MNKGKKIRIPYAMSVFGMEEKRAVNKVLETPQIVAGQKASEFEKKVSKIFGKKFGIFVNSGSSANLLALEILNLPAGSEVITPILTFATTVSPIIKLGLVPVFIDSKDDGSYLLDIKQIEQSITKNTKALMVPSLFGNIPDLPLLKKIADKHKLFLIEDSCDTIGASINNKPTGLYSDITTTSFYASHIVTAAGEGGMLCVNDDIWARRSRILSGWGRQSALNETEDIDQRLKGRLGDEIYDSKFIFSEVGYNMRSTDISATFGLEQLKKLKKFSVIRNNNFFTLLEFFDQYKKYFTLPHQAPNVITNWLAFPLTIKPDAPFTRNEIVKYLEYNNVQTRPVFTGNILKHPGFKNIKRIERSGGYPVADYITKNSFVVGCHNGLKSIHIKGIKTIFSEFLKKYEKISS